MAKRRTLLSVRSVQINGVGTRERHQFHHADRAGASGRHRHRRYFGGFAVCDAGTLNIPQFAMRDLDQPMSIPQRFIRLKFID